jgi:hypothetical protein
MTRSTIGTATAALGVAVLIAACSADGAGIATGPDAGVNGGNGPGAAAAVCTPDVAPPTIGSMSASPNVLWPPNHKFVPVSITTSVSDACDPAPRCAISSVSSNEPVNGLGDGNTSPDWIVTGASTLLLRAERSGTGTGRVYTVGTTCTDAAGNVATGYTTVLVPHDQGKGND